MCVYKCMYVYVCVSVLFLILHSSVGGSTVCVKYVKPSLVRKIVLVCVMYVGCRYIFMYIRLCYLICFVLMVGWARWISSDLGFAYHLLLEENTIHLLQLAESVCVHPNLSSVRDIIENSVFALENAGNEFKLSLRQILRLHREVLSKENIQNREESVFKILESLLLVKFMPKQSSELFYRTLMDSRVMLFRQTPYIQYIQYIHMYVDTYIHSFIIYLFFVCK